MTKVKRLSSREIIKRIEADGWTFAKATGDDRYYRHPVKQGKVTVPHPKQDLPIKRDLPIKTQLSIWKQAGMKPPR